VEHTKRKGGELAVDIPRFQSGSPCLCQLRTTSFWPRWTSFICTDCMSGFMGHGKPSSLVTTLSNHTSLLQGGLVEGK
jgi:hypothetical protein